MNSSYFFKIKVKSRSKIDLLPISKDPGTICLIYGSIFEGTTGTFAGRITRRCLLFFCRRWSVGGGWPSYWMPICTGQKSATTCKTSTSPTWSISLCVPTMSKGADTPHLVLPCSKRAHHICGPWDWPQRTTSVPCRPSGLLLPCGLRHGPPRQVSGSLY